MTFIVNLEGQGQVILPMHLNHDILQTIDYKKLILMSTSTLGNWGSKCDLDFHG